MARERDPRLMAMTIDELVDTLAELGMWQITYERVKGYLGGLYLRFPKTAVSSAHYRVLNLVRENERDIQDIGNELVSRTLEAKNAQENK